MDVPGAIGHTVINGTTYSVHRLSTGPNSSRAGILGNYALKGPNGATYFVTDYGPKYQINSVSCGGSKHQRWTPAPRPLRGLTREHLSLFIEATEQA